MARVHVWGGGPYHPFRAQGAAFLSLLESLGHQGVYGEDRSFLSDSVLAGTDLVVLMGLDCSGSERVSAQAWEDKSRAGKTYEPLSETEARALSRFAEQGKPLLVLHAGLISFDERKEFKKLYDGRWILEKSFHPELHEFPVRVTASDHPVCKGLSDFKIEDELYCDLVKPTHSTVLLEADWKGQAQPLAWSHETKAGGRFVYIAMGHDMRAWDNPALRTLHRNAVKYLLQTRVQAP